MTQGSSVRTWLSERRRSGVSAAFAVVVAVLLGVAARAVSVVDLVVIGVLAYLVAYLVVTVVVFSLARPAQLRTWAQRDSRGTVWQRYVLGTAPGPGVSIFIATAALAVAMVWLPGRGGGSLPDGVRVAVGALLVVVGWLCTMVSFAVAYHADNLVEDGHGLDVPGADTPAWSDYVYFGVAVMTTFGTTDVTVTSAEMRRTVTANAAIAFVFNTVTVAAVVSALVGS